MSALDQVIEQDRKFAERPCALGVAPSAEVIRRTSLTESEEPLANLKDAR